MRAAGCSKSSSDGLRSSLPPLRPDIGPRLLGRSPYCLSPEFLRSGTPRKEGKVPGSGPRRRGQTGWRPPGRRTPMAARGQRAVRSNVGQLAHGIRSGGAGLGAEGRWEKPMRRSAMGRTGPPREGQAIRTLSGHDRKTSAAQRVRPDLQDSNLRVLPAEKRAQALRRVRIWHSHRSALKSCAGGDPRAGTR
jgi:hypothetical protein